MWISHVVARSLNAVNSVEGTKQQQWVNPAGRGRCTYKCFDAQHSGDRCCEFKVIWYFFKKTHFTPVLKFKSGKPSQYQIEGLTPAPISDNKIKNSLVVIPGSSNTNVLSRRLASHADPCQYETLSNSSTQRCIKRPKRVQGVVGSDPRLLPVERQLSMLCRCLLLGKWWVEFVLNLLLMKSIMK